MIEINENFKINPTSVVSLNYVNGVYKCKLKNGQLISITEEQAEEIKTAIDSGGGGGGGSIDGNILVTNSASEITNADHSKLCLLTDNTNELTYEVTDKFLKDSLAYQSSGSAYHINYTDSYMGYVPYTCAYYSGDSTRIGWIAIYCERENKVFIAYAYDSYYKYSIYDISSDSWTNIVKGTTSNIIYKSAFYYNGKIYCGGNLVYNMETNQFETIDGLNIPKLTTIYNASTRAILDGNKVYYVSSNSEMKAYDLSTNTLTTIALSTTLSNQYTSYARCIYGDYIYICGQTNYSGSSQLFYKINKNSGQVTQLTNCPFLLSRGSGCRIGNKFYVGTAGKSLIQVFNLDTETWENETITNSASDSGYLGELLTDGNYLFILNNYFNCKVAKCNFGNSTLEENKVYIYTSNDSQYKFTLMENCSISVKNVYIGDSNNQAQLCNAYVYDDENSQWVNINNGQALSI